MSSRSSKWLLVEHSATSWELLKGNRSQYAGMSSREEALRRLKMHHKPGEPVVQEEPDGYRTNITADLRKRGLIH